MAATHPDPTVQAILDRHAVYDLCVQYARALDTHDWHLLERLFLADAVYTYPGGESDTVGAIVDRCNGALTRLDASQHLLGNIEVVVEGDTATARTYFQAQHVKHGTPGGDNFVIAGTYEDRAVRTPDGWRIAHRTQTYTWRDGNPAVVMRPTT